MIVPRSARLGGWTLWLPVVLVAIGMTAGFLAVRHPGHVPPSATLGKDAFVPEVFRHQPLLLRIAGTNLTVAASLLVGIVSCGLFAVAQMSAIGFFLGVDLAAALHRMSAVRAVALVAPHGPLELAGFVLVASLEFEVLRLVVAKLRDRPVDVAEMTRALGRRTLWAAAAIVVAAVIEAFLTQPFADLVS